MHEGGSDMVPALTPSAAAVCEMLIAPPTPERLMAAARPFDAHLLRDIPSMPIMSSLLTKPSGPQKVLVLPLMECRDSAGAYLL